MSVRILIGDVRERLASLPADTFDCVVTSPPYWGLRDYGVAGQIGLEPTLGEHLAVMVEVMREVRRVLKPTGTLWLNYGDCYAGSWGAQSRGGAPSDKSTLKGNGHVGGGPKIKSLSAVQMAAAPKGTKTGSMDRTPGLKPKDLCMVPNRLAIALQEPYHLGPIKHEVDRAWLAGLIDADGCIGIRRQSNGQWNPTYIPYLTVGCSDERLVQRCADITGLGTVNLKARAGATDGRGISQRRDSFVWRLDGQIASRVIRDIFPYLVQKREQALVANAMNVSQGEARSARSKPLPAAIVDYRARLYELVKALNQRESVILPDLPAVAPNIEQGWWVRSEIIWAKPNPMPESITDRPATAHEKIFLLSKAPRYHYDADAVRQGLAEASVARLAQNVEAQEGSHRANGGAKINGTMKAVGGQYAKAYTGRSKRGHAESGVQDPSDVKRRIVEGKMAGTIPDGRNLRNYEPAPVAVWNVSTAAFREAHFATFPPELAERCLLAGCPKGGTVLDPFGGAGTTALVADRMGLDCTIIELNPEYAEIARKRIAGEQGMFQAVEVAA